MRARATAIALLVAAPVAGAPRWPREDRVLPCRPTVACTADIVAPGTVEVEAGWVVRRGAATQHQTPLLLKMSLARWLQLQVAAGATFDERRTVDDLVVHAKLHVLD
jgi:hypothetical protein